MSIKINNEEVVKRLELYQKCEFVHTLTCGVDSSHKPLKILIDDERPVLVCNDCGYKQTEIPNVIFHDNFYRYINSKNNLYEILLEKQYS